MKIYRDRRDERLEYCGRTDGLEVYRDSKTGRRYIGMWGRTGLRPITRKELQELVIGSC